MALLPRSAMYRFQVAAEERILRAEQHRLALLIEPGYGKSVVTSTALLDLGAWPALVVAPARVARQVWPALPREWEHLQNLQVTAIAGPGGKLRKEVEDWERERFKTVSVDEVPNLELDSHIETVSYENLYWLSEFIDLRKRYRAIVFDELSKMKSPGSARFRRMRGSAMQIPVRIGLTGNPMGNHHLDLWGEMFMVAGEKPLGRTYTDFRDRYFQPTDYMQRNWELKHSPTCPRYDDVGKPCQCSLARECEREIAKRCAPYAYVLPEQPEVQVPKWVPNVVNVEMPERVLKNHEELHRQLWTELESGTELEALSKSAVGIKCQQLAGGAVYKNPQVLDGGVPFADLFSESDYEEVHTAKLDALDDLLDELQGQPALVFYWFRHEEQRIIKRLKRAGRRFAVGASPKNLEAWNAGQLEALLLHPRSAGHGLNLQHGGHTGIAFTLPWGWEEVDQMFRRLARIGQRAPVVPAHILSCGPADQRVLPVVLKKADAERRFFADVLAA